MACGRVIDPRVTRFLVVNWLPPCLRLSDLHPCSGAPVLAVASFISTPLKKEPFSTHVLVQARLNLDDAQKEHYRQELERMEAEYRTEQQRRLTTNDFDPLVIIGRGAFGEVRALWDEGQAKEGEEEAKGWNGIEAVAVMLGGRGGVKGEKLKVACLLRIFLNSERMEHLSICPHLPRCPLRQVRLVRKRADGEIYAMKSMIKEAMVRKNQVGHVRAERDVLAVADNPWIVTLHYSFQDDHVSREGGKKGGW